MEGTKESRERERERGPGESVGWWGREWKEGKEGIKGAFYLGDR